MGAYSVLMSVYAKEVSRYFWLSIESMLNQTVPPEEFVLVCDGPLTAELDDVIAGFQLANPDLFHVIRLPENKGLGIALQEGLLVCRNELVARMDADDIALPDRMEKQLAAMEAQGNPCIVGGQIAEFNDDPANIIGYRKVPITNEDIHRRAGFRCPVNHMTVLMRRSEVLAAGGYQHFPTYEDYHLWTRLLARGCRFYNVPDVCCNVRVDRDFYVRRGGWEYFVKTYRMERYIQENGLINGLQFWKNITIRFVGTVMVPKKFRGYLFTKILRKKELNQENRIGIAQ